MKSPTLLLLVVWFSTAALAADMPAVLTAKSPIRVWVDQIGYRPSARKLIVIAGNAPVAPSLNLELRDSKSNEAVWKLKDKPNALKSFNADKKDGESGDFIAHLDLSEFTTPGRYYVAFENNGQWLRSYQFNIAEDVYRGAGLAVWKALYYNRADCEKLEKHAGVWNHGPAFLGPNQSKEARLYKWTGKPHYEPVGTEILDQTPHDVSGGWWDAGDFNKYTGNTVRCHNDLLLALQLIGSAAAKDGDLNMPESGNGVPDLLDEIRWGTEYLIRIADTDGAAFGKAHELGGSPPESIKNPVQLTAKTSSATMARAAALAYAAVVWREFKLDEPFAQKCQDEALRSWKLLQEKPHPWPADAKDPKKQAYTGDWFSLSYEQERALFAACMFNLTGNADYDKIVKEFAPKLKAFAPGDEGDLYPLLWLYPRTKGADAAISEQMKKLLTSAADTCVSWTGEKRGYCLGVKGYWWGSNSLVGRTAVPCIICAEMANDSALKTKYLNAAEEYLHYLYGRNPLGLCYATNMKQFGAERSIMIMFHSWLGNMGKQNDPYAKKFIGEGDGRVGPPPGYIVGGANGGMKRYNDTLNGVPWEFNEPDITYQSPCATLLTYFGLKVR